MISWSLILGAAHVIGFIASINALMSVRTPQGSVAWILSLNLIPIIAVPAYWVLGRKRFKGYRIARQSEDSELADIVKKLSADAQQYVGKLEGDQGRIQAAERLAKIPFVTGNEIELLVDGHDTFKSILQGIAEANVYVLVQFYIVKDDQIGRDLKRHMVEASSRGVKVYFLYDEIGSNSLPRSYVNELRTQGVDVTHFNTTRGFGNRFQLNFRNHRKIVVTDGQSAWVGGHNVGDEYLGRDPKFGPWRDTHVRISGPAVMALQLCFQEDWNWATDKRLDISWKPTRTSDGAVPVLILPSGPADKLETASLMFQHAIHSATGRIWIASPYFVPDEAIVGALHLAVLRGVDVRILIPDKADHLLVYMSAFAFVGEMLRSGIKIYRYENGFLHAKSFLVDDNLAAVGTANLDNRSFRLNFEITAIAVDQDFTEKAATMFEQDFARSHEMSVEDIENKSFWFRVASRAAYLSAPIL